MLTVLELLILQERGVLSMDDSPLNWFPHWNISKDTTLEALASHMAGLGRDRTQSRLTFDPSSPLGFTGDLTLRCGRPGFTCTAHEAVDLILGEEPVFGLFAQPSCTSPKGLLMRFQRRVRVTRDDN
jgi:hypothetical protein